jgi:hypothetical protein
MIIERLLLAQSCLSCRVTRPELIGHHAARRQTKNKVFAHAFLALWITTTTAGKKKKNKDIWHQATVVSHLPQQDFPG